MAQIGNKLNSKLNREWAKHVRKWFKRITSHKRRKQGKKIVNKQLSEGD
jgi:hypothetical protein